MKALKRLLVIIIVASLLPAGQVWAAGSSVITSADVNVLEKTQRKIITISWTGDSAGGSMPAITVGASTYGITGWYLYTAETNPGSTAPTDNYDIVINDADGVDVAGGLLANRHTTTTQLVNIGTSAYGYPLIRGDLSVAITNNIVNSATGTIIMVFTAN